VLLTVNYRLVKARVWYDTLAPFGPLNVTDTMFTMTVRCELELFCRQPYAMLTYCIWRAQPSPWLQRLIDAAGIDVGPAIARRVNEAADAVMPMRPPSALATQLLQYLQPASSTERRLDVRTCKTLILALIITLASILTPNSTLTQIQKSNQYSFSSLICTASEAQSGPPTWQTATALMGQAAAGSVAAGSTEC